MRLNVSETATSTFLQDSLLDAHWISYEVPSGKVRHSCAALWKNSANTNWYSPLISWRDNEFDLRPFMLVFPYADGEIKHFVSAMEWLDQICRASNSLEEVQSAINNNSERGLRW